MHVRLFNGETFPYHKALEYWDLQHETQHSEWHMHSTSCMYIHMEVRELESLYGGVFLFQTMISELLLWVVTLWGYISYQCVGGAQGKGWIEEKESSEW